MISVAEISVVTVYSDLMAFVLAFGLEFMYHRYRRWKDRMGDSIFLQLCILTMVNAIANGISYAMHYNPLPWPDPIKRLFPTISELTVLVLLYVWFLYVDYKLYGSRDRIRAVRKWFRTPLLIMAGLLFINLFTGFIFTMDENSLFTARPLFYVVTIVQYTYGAFPIATMIRYIWLHGKVKFFDLVPVAAPVISASLFTLFTEYSARAFGFAVALVFLHCSYANLFRFCDGESGFYNGDYFEQYKRDVEKKKKHCAAIMYFEVQNPVPEFFSILRQELPKEGEIMRIDPHTFLLPLETGNASMQKLMTSMIEEDVGEYEENHPGEPPIGLTIRINQTM